MEMPDYQSYYNNHRNDDIKLTEHTFDLSKRIVEVIGLHEVHVVEKDFIFIVRDNKILDFMYVCENDGETGTVFCDAIIFHGHDSIAVYNFTINVHEYIWTR